MKKRLQKKIVHRKIKDYRSFRTKAPALYHWRRRLVTIHPCGDEEDIIRKLGILVEDCRSVDGYFDYKNFFIWFAVYGTECNKEGNSFTNYFVAGDKYRSYNWNSHHFVINVDVPFILTTDIAKILVFLEDWINENEDFMKKRSFPANGRFGEAIRIFDGDILAQK